MFTQRSRLFALFLLISLLLFGAAPSAAPARSAPDVAPLPVLSAQGLQKILDDSRGVPLIIEYWASWCGPCRRFRPKLERIRALYPESELRILAISLDEDPGQAEAYAAKAPFPYPVAVADDALRESRAGTSIPRTEFFGRDGVMVRAATGDMQEKRLNHYVKRLLEK